MFITSFCCSSKVGVMENDPVMIKIINSDNKYIIEELMITPNEWWNINKKKLKQSLSDRDLKTIFLETYIAKDIDSIIKWMDFSYQEKVEFMEKNDWFGKQNIMIPKDCGFFSDALAVVSYNRILDMSKTKKTYAKKKKAIPKRIKTLVWNEYIGEDIGSSLCLCCKKEKITQMNFTCGHVLSEAEGGEITVENLRPICNPCNLSMGTKHMDDFMKEHKL